MTTKVDDNSKAVAGRVTLGASDCGGLKSSTIIVVTFWVRVAGLEVPARYLSSRILRMRLLYCTAVDSNQPNARVRANGFHRFNGAVA